jgi:hypothetical protein
MTARQRKLLLLCAGIFAASYVIRFIAIASMRAAYYQRQAVQAARQRALQAARKKKESEQQPKAAVNAAPAKQPAPVAPPSAVIATPTPPSPLAKLAGIWRGNAALSGRGVCALRLELRESPGEPGQFTGYSGLICNSAGPLMGKHPNAASAIINRMDPEAAILTGAVEDGAIRLHTDKTVGADSRGCAVSSLTVTPFGTNFIDAAWQEHSCQGGHVILRRSRK